MTGFIGYGFVVDDPSVRSHYHRFDLHDRIDDKMMTLMDDDKVFVGYRCTEMYSDYMKLKDNQMNELIKIKTMENKDLDIAQKTLKSSSLINDHDEPELFTIFVNN